MVTKVTVTITDAKGVKHDWRKDLAEELAKRQQADGSWVNTNAKWMEGDANLSTGFALLALSAPRFVSTSWQFSQTAKKAQTSMNP